MRANSNNNNMNKQKAVITCVLAETVDSIKTPSSRINYAISLVSIYIISDYKLKRIKRLQNGRNLSTNIRKKTINS